jgi:hypothetical protein
MVKKVQQIHAVLCDVIHRVSGTQYIGIGVAIEIKAIMETVNGKPKLSGHLLWSARNQRIGRDESVPVETVDIEHFCDPHQSCDVIESIIHKQEEPKVYLDSRFSVTWYFVPVVYFEWYFIIIRQIVLRKR